MMSRKAFPPSGGAPSRVLDESRKCLSKVSQISDSNEENVVAINLNGNNLSTLNGIRKFSSLIQLSVTENSLVRMDAVASLFNLVSLNLQNNSISDIAGLEKMVNLEWLCLAGNNIKSIDGLATNVMLNHLDISDNCISSLANISMLNQLKILLLHGNAIRSLQSVKDNLPICLNTLSLAENEVSDLNEVSFISSLQSLTQLSLMSNPCVLLSDSGLFDYRPYIVYWCPGLTILDGYYVTKHERQCSTTLFSQYKAYPFTIGQHQELINYLHSASPLHTAQFNGSLNVSEDHLKLASLSVSDDIMFKEQSMSSDFKQADIMEKLRALQVVEEMIKNQEYLLSQRSEMPTSDNMKNKPNNTNDPVSIEVGLTMTRCEPITVKPVIDLNPSVISRKKTMTEQTSSEKATVGEGSLEQLKLLNAKIAQRQTKVVYVPGKPQTPTDMSKIKQNTNLVSEGNSVNTPDQRAMNLPKSLMKETDHLETSTSGTKAKPLTKAQSNPERPPVITYVQGVLPGNKLASAESSRVSQTPNILQYFQPSPSNYEASLDKTLPCFDTSGVSTTLVRTDTDPDLLTSTSYYVLASEAAIDKITLDNQFEAALRQESQGSSNSLASSLTQAYGVAELLETSEVLSILQNPRSFATDSDIRVKESNQKKEMSGKSIQTDDDVFDSCDAVNLPQSNDLFGQVDEEPQGFSNPLASSLTQAYGVTEVLETSEVLSTPQNPRSFATDSDVRVKESNQKKEMSGRSTLTDDEIFDSCEAVNLPQSNDLFGQVDEESQGFSNPLASSLTQAYGVTEVLETSEVLSTPQNPRSFATDSDVRVKESNQKKEMSGRSTLTDDEIFDSCEAVNLPQSNDLFGQVDEESQGFSNPLASSLTQAYGVTEVLEISEVLSTLQNPRSFATDSDVRVKESNQKKEMSGGCTLTDDKLFYSCEAVNLPQSNDLFEQVGEEVAKERYCEADNRSAIVIQSAWRGYMTRKYDPKVIEARSALNYNRLEALVLKSAHLLDGCRQELAHQSQVIQLQEETLNTLLVEVDGLHLWKTKIETKNGHNAAIVIQKHWRGYMVRKCFPCRGKTLSRTDSLWTLCVSLKAQVKEMKCYFDALIGKDGAGKTVRFEKECILPLPGGFPPPTDLTMIHFSLSCILLRWTPANTPSSPDVTTRKCYRIYVNGEVEGMVGPEKCKAYIEGLDPHINYRITVRAVYNMGESQDSNPVVASLNPKKLAHTKPHSPQKSNSDHSSDEDGGHSRKNPFVSSREASDSPGQPPGQSGNSVNNGQQPKEQTHLSTSEGKCIVEHQEATIDPLLAQSKEEVSIIPVQTESAHIQNDQYPSDMVAHTSPSLENYPNLVIESYHFQKAKHITIDTVSVLSGCTIEYSPPLPQASNSADTLGGESSFECDDDDRTSSESSNISSGSRKSNRDVIHDQDHDESLNTGDRNTNDHTFVNLIESDNKVHDSGVEQGESFIEHSGASEETDVANEISHSVTSPNLTFASTQQRNASGNVQNVSTAVQHDYSFMTKPLKTSIHEMHIPHSKQLSHMSAPVLYAVDEQLLSLASTQSHEAYSVGDTIFNSLPELNHRNICNPLATDLEIYPQQSRSDEQDEHVLSPGMVSNYNQVETFPTAVIVPEVKNPAPPEVTHEPTSLLPLHTSHTSYKQPFVYQVSPERGPVLKITDATLEREHQNKELGSCVKKPAYAYQKENDLQEPGLATNEIVDQKQEAWQPDLSSDVVTLETNLLPRADTSVSKET